MRLNEKAAIRKSILELCNKGIPRSLSIDDQIRKISNTKETSNENLWDSVVVLGAQLSRPPFDPYREEIKLETKIGRSGTRKVILNMPILIYVHIKLSQNEQDVLDMALNRLAESGIIVGIISEKEPSKKRKYPHFQFVDDVHNNIESEGIVLQYHGRETIEKITNIRKEFEIPIVVEVDENFMDYTSELLKAQTDAILINTDKITKTEKFKGRHAISVIRTAKKAIYEFYKGKEGDGASLIVAGDVNNSGKIIKAAGLGADVIGYDTSLFLAKTGQNLGSVFDLERTADRIFKHLSATRDELTGIPAAVGYTNFHNLIRTDYRTYSIQASLEGDIPLEGVNKTYLELIEGIVDDYLKDKGIDLDMQQKQKIVQLIMVG